MPHHTFSLWNNYEIARRFGAAFGIIHRSSMFAAIDNTVTLPGYTRADAGRVLPVRQELAAAGERGERVRHELLRQRG